MGSKGGGGGGSGAGLAQAQLAREVRAESKPLRQLVTNELLATLGGSQTVPAQTIQVPNSDNPKLSAVPGGTFTRGIGGGSTLQVPERQTLSSRLIGAGLEDVAGQFDQARRSILQGGARGGQLTSALNDVAIGRARAASGVRRSALQNAFSQAAAIGNQQTGLAFHGLAGAGQLDAQRNAIQAQQQAALGQGIGTTVGLLALAAAKSDRRLKTIIHRLADDIRGFGWYAFEYVAEPGRRYVGVIAQEVLPIRPDAVSLGADGYYRVEYGRL